MQRVVVDTNVWVSALLNTAGYPARILAALIVVHSVQHFLDILVADNPDANTT